MISNNRMSWSLLHFTISLSMMLGSEETSRSDWRILSQSSNNASTFVSFTFLWSSTDRASTWQRSSTMKVFASNIESIFFLSRSIWSLFDYHHLETNLWTWKHCSKENHRKSTISTSLWEISSLQPIDSRSIEEPCNIIIHNGEIYQRLLQSYQVYLSKWIFVHFSMTDRSMNLEFSSRSSKSLEIDRLSQWIISTWIPSRTFNIRLHGENSSFEYRVDWNHLHPPSSYRCSFLLSFVPSVHCTFMSLYFRYSNIFIRSFLVIFSDLCRNGPMSLFLFLKSLINLFSPLTKSLLSSTMIDHHSRWWPLVLIFDWMRFFPFILNFIGCSFQSRQFFVMLNMKVIEQ